MWHPLLGKFLIIAVIFQVFLITQTNSLYFDLQQPKSLGEKNFEKFVHYLKVTKSTNSMPYLRKNNAASNNNWPSMDMCSKFPKCIDQLVLYIENKFKDFEDYLTWIISQNLKNYFKIEVEKAKTVYEITNIQSYLINLKNELSTKKSFEQFLNTVSVDFLNKTKIEKMITKKLELDSFTALLEKQHNFPNERKWTNQQLILEINELIDELNQYSKKAESIYSNGIFKVSCYFCSMSEVLSIFKQNTNINDLKKFQILATNSFDFNADFALNEEVYSFDHPDLVIIAPYIVFSKKITVDLSTKKIPGYPENIAKAENGRGVGDSGENGKPGLQGFDSGNLIVYADKIKNSDNLVFVSIGGNGGPGQAGGDGNDGKKGRPILVSESKEICEKDRSKCISGENPNNLSPKDAIPGTKGGDSGKPGRGGLSGNYGNANLISSERSEVLIGSQGSRGQNGELGKAGIGGQYGDIFYSIYFSLIDGFMGLPIDIQRVSDLRAENGLVVQSPNEDGIMRRKEKIVQLYDIETEYLRFISKLNSNLKYSNLIGREFCKNKNLIRFYRFYPSVENLIDRFNVLNNYESKHLLDELKNQLVYFYTNTNLEKDDTQAFNYTYTAVVSSIYRFNSMDQTALVVDVKNFLELTIEQINNWKSLAKQSAREIYKKNYYDNLKNKIDEAKKFVDVLFKDIADNEKKMNTVIKSIISEIKEMQNSAFRNDSLLRKQKLELERSVLIKKIFGAVKIGCQVLSFLGPKAQLAGSLIETGIGVAKMFSPETIKIPDINKNPSIDIAIKGMIEKIQNHKEAKFKDIENELVRLEKENKKEGEKEKSIYERIDLLPNSVFKFELKIKYSDYVKKDSTDPGKLQEADTNKKDAELKLEKEKKNLESIQKYTDKISNVIDTIKVAKEVYDEFSQADQELEIMSEAIKSNAKYFENLNILEDQIIEFENMIVGNIQKQIVEISKNLTGSSLASLEITRWNTKRTLEEFKDIVLQTLGSFSKNSEMITTINRIDSSFSSMVSIYEKIESYIEQNEFASYIYDITQTETAIGIPYKYQSKINELKKSIHSNIIIDRYHQAIDAFKYWSFPFFCQYTSDLAIYDAKVNNYEKTDEMINNLANSLQSLLNRIKNFETQLKPVIDNYIQGFSFENDFSFFKWSSAKYPIEIEQLLNGRKTTFLADFDEENGEVFDAVKFCTIYLTIETKDPVKNEKLKNLLKKFFVELTHSGISKYKLNKNKYTIDMNLNKGEKLKLRYPYSSTDSNEGNESYKKLSSNKAILSPYTFWDIELVSISKNNEYMLLNELSMLVKNEEVIVSLNGKGQYLVPNEHYAETCENNFRTSKK